VRLADLSKPRSGHLAPVRLRHSHCALTSIEDTSTCDPCVKPVVQTENLTQPLVSVFTLFGVFGHLLALPEGTLVNLWTGQVLRGKIQNFLPLLSNEGVSLASSM
jgi:hypothetical protein